MERYPNSMKENLASELGESYHYIKTILKSELELKMISMVTNISQTISNILLSICACISVSVLLVMSIGWMYSLALNYAGSMLVSIMIVILYVALIIILVLILKNKLIVQPLKNILYQKLVQNDD